MLLLALFDERYKNIRGLGAERKQHVRDTLRAETEAIRRLEQRMVDVCVWCTVRSDDVSVTQTSLFEVESGGLQLEVDGPIKGRGTAEQTVEFRSLPETVDTELVHFRCGGMHMDGYSNQQFRVSSYAYLTRAHELGLCYLEWGAATAKADHLERNHMSVDFHRSDDQFHSTLILAFPTTTD